MKKRLIIKMMAVMAMLITSANMWASHGTHYGKFVATTTGGGKVYVSTNQNSTPAYDTTSEVTWNCGGSSNSDSKKGYFSAQADEGWTFAGWYQNSTFKSSTAQKYEIDLKATSTDSKSPTTLTLQARFKWENASIIESEFTGEHLCLYPAAQGNKFINKGADYGTRAILSDIPMELTLTQDNKTNMVTIGTYDNNFLFDAGEYKIYTDNTVSGNQNINFIFSGDNESGYKIYIPNDLNWAIGTAVEQFEGKDYTVLKLVRATGAPLWKIGKTTPVTMSVKAEAHYSTFCAPFAVEVPEGVTASTATLDTDGATIKLESVGAVIPANTPVILYAEAGLTPTTIRGMAAENTATAGVLTGVYSDTPAPVGSYVLQKNDRVGFFKVAEGNQPTVGANHAYLTASSPSLAFFFDNETAIEAVEALTTGEKEIYDLNGVKHNSLQKGINIIKLANGKTQKILVK